ncbi:MAG: CheF family chemotaxis protein [Halobacteriales archaeon]
MSKSIIADFFGETFIEDITDEPVPCRVLLSDSELLLATETQQTTIELDTIFDINVTEVPKDLRPFFKNAITIAYNDDAVEGTAVIEADDEDIERFTTVLFKALLNGTEVRVEHPARRGGRVTDVDPRTAELFVRPEEVAFTKLTEPFRIRLDSVSGFKRTERDLGKFPPALAITIQHFPEGTELTTNLVLPTARKLQLLGRYLRQRYDEVMDDVSEIELSDDEMETLVGLYSAPDDLHLSNVVDIDASRVSILLNRLQEKDLVTTTDDSMVLTGRGRILVSDRIETVNH